MSKGRILLVEPDEATLNLIDGYFVGQGYLVVTATNGRDALIETQKEELPDLIILHVHLPEISGYEVCRTLRTNTYTVDIPIIFLEEYVERRTDRIIDLEMGADDFVSKPFDIEELRLRIENGIRMSKRAKKISPISGLPLGELTESHFQDLLKQQVAFAYVEPKIQHYAEYKLIYGWSAANEAIKTLTRIIMNCIDEFGTDKDFVGHPSEAEFVIFCHTEARPLIEALKARFDKEIPRQYSFIDREQGFMLVDGKEIPLMSLAIRIEMKG